MLMGIIADDLTGASDIAGFVAGEGLDVIQFVGIPGDGGIACDAAVVSLKSRSAPAPEAIRDSLAALDWLRRQGCPRFYFKYCSTFDSTPKGNIGPVADAMLDALGESLTVVCPSLPVNGRTVRDGILYVNGVPLSDTGMRNHPLTPMTDSNLLRLMEAQSRGRAGLLGVETVERGPEAVRECLSRMRGDGIRYAVLDAETDAHLEILGKALADELLLTGGSGLGRAAARRLASLHSGIAGHVRRKGPASGNTVVFSGSCSEMTNRQTAAYRKLAPEFQVEAARCLENAAVYAEEGVAWVKAHSAGKYAPMISATVPPDHLRAIQSRFGAGEAAAAVEGFFRQVAICLRQSGYVNFIVAGGETAGAVSEALGVRSFRIGPEIAPGVCWVEAVRGRLGLAMKSGNFGDESFFQKAQAMIR
ncbi:MAG: four-carbon acid sugar kinase family protein [Planctomycetota bacterium]|jgi:uncharacterized protein YgbK (DUF1537 family)|nr:four-carbon acid sugar kinase family protein [Planctomycetota bacterium]